MSERLRIAMQAALVVIVAVEGDVERAERDFELERLVQALRDPHAAGVDSDQTRFRPHRGPHLLRERLEQLLGVG